MAAIFRLGSRNILNQILKNEKMGMLSLVRPVTVRVEAALPHKDVDHDEHNMKLGRPLSPHLTIYEFQITTVLSISHRATGMMLAGYAMLLGAGAVFLPETMEFYLANLAKSDVSSLTLLTGKFLLAFPASFHFWNGIRHLLWDLGLFLSIKEVYITGYAMLLITLGSTVALMAM